MPAFLATFADLIDHLLIGSRGGAQDAEQRDIRAAAFLAYKHLTNCRDWRYYKKQYRIVFSAPQTSSTITYTNSTRALTLASGTWPSWAKSGTVLIGDVLSEVATRTSDTVLTLDATRHPEDDVAAGTSYTLFRTCYSLPADWRGNWSPVNEESVRYNYVEPENWHDEERMFYSNTDQWRWTITQDPENYAQYALRMLGYPTAVDTLDFLYQGRARAIKLTGYESKCMDGTLAASASASTATGTSTAFSSDMIGAILRVQTGTGATDHPTGIADLNPWTEQKVITAVGSTTALTLDSAWDATYSGVKFRISDPLDIPEELWEPLVRRAEYELAMIRNSERMGYHWKAWESAYKTAIANESGHVKEDMYWGERPNPGFSFKGYWKIGSSVGDDFG